jgi:glycerol-3-phosphate dehydrogenase
VSFYFERGISPRDVVWSYAGLRALADDGATAPSRITREYAVSFSGSAAEAPLVSLTGGKITTHRSLAERVVDRLGVWLRPPRGAWTRQAVLPGGQFASGPAAFEREIAAAYPHIDGEVLAVLAARHGALVRAVLGACATTAQLGRFFGHTLYAREVDYFMEREWARCTEDVLWRRTKEGLHLGAAQKSALDDYVRVRACAPPDRRGGMPAR